MDLLSSVVTFREENDTNERPIILVCHGLRGLVCEDALSKSSTRPKPHLHAIIDSTCGIIFLGTPHRGSGLARWASILAILIGLVKQTNTHILGVLERNSEVLTRVQEEFHTMVGYRESSICCFYEALPLPGIGIVVSKESAIIPGYVPISIHDNHMGMTKFEFDDDPGFKAITGELRRWIKNLVLVALFGLGGVGKSQLAIEFSFRTRIDHPEWWVFWLHAGTTARFEEGYKAIAEKAKMEGRDKTANILQLVSDWLGDESSTVRVVTFTKRRETKT